MAPRFDPNPIDVAVGGRIRARRKVLRLSQGAIAAAVGLTFQQVQKYERGANRVSASMLVKVAAALETSVAVLVGEADMTREPLIDLDHFLSDPEVRELLDAFALIKDGNVRNSIVQIVRSMSKGSPPQA